MVQKIRGANVKVYELFQECERQKLFRTIKKRHSLLNFTEDVFNQKLSRLMSHIDKNSVSKYHVVFTPYLSVNGSGMEHDLFLLETDEVLQIMHYQYTPKQTLLFTTRRNCDSVEVSEIMNANLCKLSQNNFSKYDICAEIFFEVAIDVSELETYTMDEAIDFIQKIREQLSAPQRPSTDEDIEYTISQNVIFAYPYYSSVANDAS